MSERDGFRPPEAQNEKLEGDSKAEARRNAFSASERSPASPESLGSGDVNKPKPQGVGDDSSQTNDSTTSKAQGDANSGKQQQPGDQAQAAKASDNSAQQQDKTDAERLREVRAELSRHSSFRQ